VRIDEGVKREILARADIGEVIGAYVTLRKRGNDLVGLCPFHGEKSPSFHVHPDRGFFKCFGCGAAGDVFTFVQKQENVAFPDALRILGKRYGVEVETENPFEARRRSEREAIYHANEVARAWFHRMLLDPREGAAAHAYCTNRGITDDTIERFSLGFAPDRWDGLVAELRKNDVDLALAAKAGLLKPSQRGGFYDFYRGRLMIPTLGITGETIAFGGRALGTEEPKYLNTANTPVYTKGQHLFALNLARRLAAKAERIIVVEGYLDCIALHQAGFANSVAVLGTAFTVEQGTALRKVVTNAYLALDADAAGSDAMWKSVPTYLTAGLNVRIIKLPPGDDPDSFIRTHGASAFQRLIDDAVPWHQFLIDRELEKVGRLANPADQAKRLRAMLTAIDPLLRDTVRLEAARRLGLSADAIRVQDGVQPTRQHGIAYHRLMAYERPQKAEGVVPRSIEPPSIEREVLAIVLDEPSLLAEYAGRITADRFDDPRFRKLWETLRGHARSLVQPSDVHAVFAGDEDAAAALASVSGAVRLNDSEERRAKLDRVVARFARDDVERRYRELGERIDRLFESGEPVPTDLRAEHAALAAELKG
jgi:DNA primase